MENGVADDIEINKSERETFALLLRDQSNKNLETLKQFILMISITEPARWKLEMVLALKENQPFEVFRIAGSHIFSGDDVNIVHIFLDCATELLEASGVL